VKLESIVFPQSRFVYSRSINQRCVRASVKRTRMDAPVVCNQRCVRASTLDAPYGYRSSLCHRTHHLFERIQIDGDQTLGRLVQIEDDIDYQSHEKNKTNRPAMVNLRGFPLLLADQERR
jgi:hypothetical protein